MKYHTFIFEQICIVCTIFIVYEAVRFTEYLTNNEIRRVFILYKIQLRDTFWNKRDEIISVCMLRKMSLTTQEGAILVKLFYQNGDSVTDALQTLRKGHLTSRG